ncbi:hypothetical protein K505DRAFT_326893, partial [Melanomma pulvis-pyrius CBS 109.77]
METKAFNLKVHNFVDRRRHMVIHLLPPNFDQAPSTRPIPICFALFPIPSSSIPSHPIPSHTAPTPAPQSSPPPPPPHSNSASETWPSTRFPHH